MDGRGIAEAGSAGVSDQQCPAPGVCPGQVPVGLMVQQRQHVDDSASTFSRRTETRHFELEPEHKPAQPPAHSMAAAAVEVPAAPLHLARCQPPAPQLQACQLQRGGATQRHSAAAVLDPSAVRAATQAPRIARRHSAPLREAPPPAPAAQLRPQQHAAQSDHAASGAHPALPQHSRALSAPAVPAPPQSRASWHAAPVPAAAAAAASARLAPSQERAAPKLVHVYEPSQPAHDSAGSLHAFSAKSAASPVPDAATAGGAGFACSAAEQAQMRAQLADAPAASAAECSHTQAAGVATQHAAPALPCDMPSDDRERALARKRPAPPPPAPQAQHKHTRVDALPGGIAAPSRAASHAGAATAGAAQPPQRGEHTAVAVTHAELAASCSARAAITGATPAGAAPRGPGAAAAAQPFGPERDVPQTVTHGELASRAAPRVAPRHSSEGGGTDGGGAQRATSPGAARTMSGNGMLHDAPPALLAQRRHAYPGEGAQAPGADAARRSVLPSLSGVPCSRAS